MTKAQKALCERINRAYWEVENLCGSVYNRSNILDAVRLAAKDERAHRRFGRNLVGDISKRASIETVAHLFAVRGFFTPLEERSFTHREDYVRAYAAAADVERRKPELWAALRVKCEDVLAIDYTDLIDW